SHAADARPLDMFARSIDPSNLMPERLRTFPQSGTGVCRLAAGGEPDSNLYGAFPCQVVVFGLLPVFCSERRGVLHPVAYNQVPGARAMGSRDRNASKAWRRGA